MDSTHGMKNLGLLKPNASWTQEASGVATIQMKCSIEPKPTDNREH